MEGRRFLVLVRWRGKKYTTTIRAADSNDAQRKAARCIQDAKPGSIEVIYVVRA